MERKKHLVLVAAGSGERMGAKLPKQFLEFEGKCILHHTLDCFLEAVPEIEVTIVLNRDYFGYWKDYCRSHNIICRQHLVAGGITRYHSVKNALAGIPDGAAVAIHDGVRPFVSAELIRRMFGISEDCQALIPVLPCTDTIKVLDCKTIDGEKSFMTVPGVTVDRSRLFGAQTPQVFHSEVLKKAYLQPYDTAFTDDASVVQKDNARLSYIEGERLNIKITTPQDLILARAIDSILR